LGWTPVNVDHTDTTSAAWGGNLVAHKLYQKPNGDLAVTIPHTLESQMETSSYTVTKNSQWGNVTNTQSGTHSYRLVSPASYDMANVIFDPVMSERYQISATVNFTSSNRDFGFMIGACDGWNDLFSLRFVPGENRFSFDKTKRPDIDSSTVADNDVPINLQTGVDYSVRILLENSMVVVYINDEVALSSRIYRAPGTNWGVFADHSDVTFSNIEVTTP
ncbi:MAG: GH32 C-terminal domain-containing protein, partial [Marinoscillum sp.]